MEIPKLNNYYHADISSNKVGKKYNRDTDVNMAEAFKNEVLNWKEKIKEKNNEELENDQEKNIKMSEKQWHALMNKVDSAINPRNQGEKVDDKSDSPKPNDKNKQLYDELFAGIFEEKEKS
jgi:hypothetical protein